jgi:hypothetical protein
MAITLYQPIVFGDGDEALGGYAQADGQTISLAADIGVRSLVGDTRTLAGRALGGADTLTNFAFGEAVAIGDAVTVSGRAEGGNDSVLAGASGGAVALGDADLLNGRAKGGDDNVEARSDFNAVAYGDASEMSGYAQGGNDLVTGQNGHGFAILYGDAGTLTGAARGGDDTVYGGGGKATQMYGDGAELLGRSRGGNDRVVSGSDDDQMWGDAALVAVRAMRGLDTFAFSPGNSHDSIMDFAHGADHIELKGFGFSSFTDVESLLTYSSDGALIAFDANNSVLVVGINELVPSDFLFT